MTAGHPLVSIVIPTFNGERWLADALESAFAQTYAPLEIIVSDDRSVDSTTQIADEYARRDARLRVIVNKVTLGLAGNWNRAMRLSEGEYLKFLFQDDLLEPDCVSRMVDAAESAPSVGMVFCDREIQVESDVTSRRAEAWLTVHGRPAAGLVLQPVTPGQRILAQLAAQGLAHNLIGEPSCVLIRRSAIGGGFDGRLNQALDYEMWIRLLGGWDAAYIPERLVTFRLHGRSATSRNDDRLTYAIDRMWLSETLRRAWRQPVSHELRWARVRAVGHVLAAGLLTAPVSPGAALRVSRALRDYVRAIR